jgi:hypothetical protein
MVLLLEETIQRSMDGCLQLGPPARLSDTPTNLATKYPNFEKRRIATMT